MNKPRRWIRLIAGWSLALSPSLVVGQLPQTSISIADVSDDFQLAAAAYQRQDWEESIARFDRVLAVTVQPQERSQAFFYRGEALLQHGKYPDARASFQQFLRATPVASESESSQKVTAQFRIAQIATLTGDNNAVHLLESFLQDHPQSDFRCTALTLLGEQRIARKEFRLARRVIETALLEFPHAPESDQNRYGLSVCFIHNHEFEAARKFLDYLQQHGTHAELRARVDLQQAIIATHLGQHDAAQKLLQQLVRDHQDQASSTAFVAEVRYWQATNWLASKSFAAAVEQYDQALTQLHDVDLRLLAIHNQALALIQLGEFDSADQKLTNAAQEYAGRIPASWLLTRVEAAFGAGRFEEVVRLTAAAEPLTSGGQPHRLQELRGRSLYQLGDYEPAAALFRQLVEQSSSDDPQWVTWKRLEAMSHMGQGQWRDAYTALSSLPDHLLGHEDSAQVHLMLGDLCRHLEDFATMPRHYLHAYANYERLSAGEQHRLLEQLLQLAVQWSDVSATISLWDRWLLAEPLTDVAAPNAAVNLEPLAARRCWYAQQISDLAFQGRDFPNAARFYQVSLELAVTETDRARALAGLGWTYWEQDQHERAMTAFQELLTTAPSSPHSGHAAVLLAQRAFAQEDYAQAIQMYERALRNVTAAAQRASIQWGLVGSLKRTRLAVDRVRAIGLLEQMLQDEPHGIPPSQILYELAWLYREQQDWPQSIALFRRVTEQHRDSALWSDAAYRVAQYQFQNNDYDGASQTIADIMSQGASSPLLSRVLYLAGQISAAQQHWPEVRGFMERAADLAVDDVPQQFRCRYWQAEALYQQKQYSSAELVYRELQDYQGIAQGPDQNLAPWIQLRLSQCLIMREAWDEALEISGKALETFQDFAWSFEFDFVMGRALFATGRTSDALKAFQLVLESPTGRRTETAAQAQWRIGEIHFHQERYVEAIDAYYRVDALFSYDHWRAAALLQAGKCQEILGNWQHAIKLYTQIVEKFAQTEFVEPAKQRLEIAKRQAQLEPVEWIR